MPSSNDVPRGTLQVLVNHGTVIDEIDTAAEVRDRLDAAALTSGDVTFCRSSKPIVPIRWNDHILIKHFEQARAGALLAEFPHVLPLVIIEPRIADLAKTFWEDPDARLFAGHRRLEDIVRKRICSSAFGKNLFEEAFKGKSSKLCWDLPGAEQEGRASMFTSLLVAHRNPRAHRELRPAASDLLSKFLVLNHLFRLESQARERRSQEASTEDA